jgi:hypothetical protein
MKVYNPNNLPTISIADLLPTQGNLKDLTEKNYNKLKNTILKRGFSVPVYIWEDEKEIKHLLDGHQRQRVLTTEGWTEPIPYLKIPAENLQEAMARLLEITSQYATITQEGIDEFIAKYELPEAEVYESTSFDALVNYSDSEELEDEESPYTGKIEPPIYEITGESPSLDELIDTSKTNELVKEIEKSIIDKEIKSFLISAAQRHTVFNYEKIAEYYANSPKEVQKLIEDSVLVIIDYNQAIEKGFVQMSEEIAETFIDEKD